MYNSNYIIVIIFNCICVYAHDYTLVKNNIIDNFFFITFIYNLLKWQIFTGFHMNLSLILVYYLPMTTCHYHSLVLKIFVIEVVAVELLKREKYNLFLVIWPYNSLVHQFSTITLIP